MTENPCIGVNQNSLMIIMSLMNITIFVLMLLMNITILTNNHHQDLRLTYADSVPQLGGRKPLNPSLKDGVVIRF